MEFYKNLIPPFKKPKSKLALILLIILFVVLIVAQLYVNIKAGMGAINYFNIVFWFLWLVLFVVQSFTGKRIESLFGKAYIHINDEFIKLKTSVLKKEQTIFWKNLRRLSMKPSYIKVIGQEGNQISIDFKNLEYQAVQELKKTVKTLIDEQKIVISSTGS